jgi:hypothetical protein
MSTLVCHLDRLLPVETVAVFMRVIGTRAVLDRLAELGVRPACCGFGGGQRLPADRLHLLAEEVDGGVECGRRNAAEIGPVLVKDDVGRIRRERHVRSDPVGGIVNYRLVGPAKALRKMHAQPLLGFFECQGGALLIERPQELHPAVPDEQHFGHHGRDRDHGRNAVVQAG